MSAGERTGAGADSANRARPGSAAGASTSSIAGGAPDTAAGVSRRHEAVAPILGRDEAPQTALGAALRRQDGVPKVRGEASYAGEEHPPNLLQAVMVTSPIANGRVGRIDADEAERLPGVVRVLTHADLPKLAQAPVPPLAQSVTPMQDAVVRYEGQPVALVLGETLEAAEQGAARVAVEYLPERPTVFAGGRAAAPRAEGNGYAFAEIDTAKGDADAAFETAPVKLEAEYLAPTRHHNMMEPSTTLAEWRGDELHMHDATQWTYGIRYALAALLEMPPEKIHVLCPYTGGGFGAKGYVWPHQVLAPLAARIAGRPVKLAIERVGCYTDTGYQPVVRSRMRLGADDDGRLTAIIHETENVSSRDDDYVEYGSAGTRALYATPAMRTRTRIVKADVGTPTAMRAPHEGPGMFATECAMDELARALDMDPLELRRKNYADEDPRTGKPFSSKRLDAVYAEAAKRFGWAGREPAPRSMRDGDLLIGWGMATGIMTTFRFASNARIRLEANGRIVIEAGCQEIGTGPYTVMPQVAAEVLGVPAERIELSLGDTGLPETGGTFGSSTTLSTGSAVADAAEKLMKRLAALAGADEPPPAEAWTDLLRERGVGELVADGRFGLPGDVPFDAHGGQSDHSMHTWGAVFVEMAVDEALGLARMRRCVAGYSAGRILNPRTARSQMIGGIIWGYGRAMLEESAMDPRYGRYLSKNLSGVMLPVNADIPQDIDVFFVDEHDPHASAIGARGIGELGEVGVASAIANALFHATGKRIRELPIKIERLLG